METLAPTDEAQTSAKNRRVSKIPRSRTLAKITQRNRVSSGKENDAPRATSQAPGAFKKPPAQDIHRGSRGGKPPKPSIKHARSLEDLKSSREVASTTAQSTVLTNAQGVLVGAPTVHHKPSQKPKGGVPEALSYQELKRLCHKLTQEQAMRSEEVAMTEKKMAAIKEEMTHTQSMLSQVQQSLEESAREHRAASDALGIVSTERDAYLVLLERNAIDVLSGEVVVSSLKAASEDREIELQVDASRLALEELLQTCIADTATLKKKVREFKETVAVIV